MNLFLVLYFVGSTSPAGLVPSTAPDRAGCELQAAKEQAAMAARGDPFRVKCEFRGPNDMVWKLHPELRGGK